MVIELRGLNYVNKGAELMLNAILDQAQSWSDDIQLAVNLNTGGFIKNVKRGLFHVAWRESRKFPSIGEKIEKCLGFLPKGIRRALKIALPCEIDAVLDASGFAYSDQWGLFNVRALSRLVEKYSRNHMKVILLPQAFGPFKNYAIRREMSKAIDKSSLVFARDKISLQHVLSLGDYNHKVKLFPDFTNLVPGYLPEYIDSSKMLGVVIPNYRMIDKTDKKISSHYIDFLSNCIIQLSILKIQPVILIHETGRDIELATSIRNKAGMSVEIIRERDPLKIKGIIGKSFLVVASRYHAIVSALSQSIPCLGTGWSHKYYQLFEDYGVAEFFVSVDQDKNLVNSRLRELATYTSRDRVIERLRKKSSLQKALTLQMWQHVHNTLFDL